MAALGLSTTDGWKWLVLLVSFAAIYVTLGVLLFHPGGGRMTARQASGDAAPAIGPPASSGSAALVAVAANAWIGLVVSPPDVVQGDLVRLIYVHPAAATTCYVGFGLCALASLAYLWPRTRSRRWDRWPAPRPRSAWCSAPSP